MSPEKGQPALLRLDQVSESKDAAQHRGRNDIVPAEIIDPDSRLHSSVVRQRPSAVRR